VRAGGSEWLARLRRVTIFVMRWTSLAASLGLLLGACVDMDDSGSAIVGTSGDVATEPGDYVGYRVVTPCEDAYVNIGVIGTGSVEVTDTAQISAIGSELAASLRDVTSIWGHSGYGLACEPGVGTTIYTDSWRDVDALIVRVGELLRDRDLALQVGIGVDSQPVPLAN
jgi:hypothetical protein